MKLFNKTIDRQLFNQYSLGSDLSKQEVVVKIFNPTGAGTWFILNSDPNDPDYLWAIVDLGYGAEVGSVSRSDLENYRGRFGLGFERDLSFDPVNAEELYKGLRQGKFYADGGKFSGDEVTLMKGYGYYDLSKYAYGNDFKRFIEPVTGKFVKGTIKIGGQIRVMLNDGREIITDKQAIDLPTHNEKDELYQKNKHLFSFGFADGGDIENFTDNQRMIMNQNVEVEHHHEELEDILEDEVPVPAWVVAKMETATQNLSDITHYLDGQKELTEDEEESENQEKEYGEFDYSNLDPRGASDFNVVEPINVSAGTKAELSKKFTDDALGNLKGFLKGMKGIDLRDDYTFDYKNEQFEIEPIINFDENGVSNAIFTIFDGDGEEQGEVTYSREGGKQKFTANSMFFQWNNAKFEDGGYFDGTIPNASAYMSTYAKGGEVAKAEILGFSRNVMGTTDIEMKITGMRKPQEFIVYPIGADDAGNVITIQSDTRIGQINLVKGVGVMSQSHSGGAYFVHLQMDKLTSFEISDSDLQDIKSHIFKTTGSNVGTRGIVSDNTGASRLFAQGGGIGFIPMALEQDLSHTAKWGGTDIKGVIGILNAMIDSGLTDEDLKPKPTKSGTAHQNAIEKKTKEIWAKIEPNYKGELQGNMYYSTIRRLVDRANSPDEILKRFKPFRKLQKDSFAKGGGLDNDGYNLKDIKGKKIEVGDTVKTTQPSGGLLNPADSETGVVEKTKDAFGQESLQIRYRKQGTNYDRFILLNGKINEIVEKTSSFTKGGSLEDKLTKLENKKSDLESKLLEAQLKSNSVMNNIGFGAGMRRSKVGFSTSREDSLKERIESVEQEIEQVKEDMLPKKPKYILKADIKTVTVNRKGKEVTYKGADVLNGANVLADGGDISSKANYVPKRDVIEVELKDGSKIKPVNGYWVKKNAEPVGADPSPTSSGSSEPKIGTTEIRKDPRGNWRAETFIENFNNYDWKLTTIKTYSGQLLTSAQGGKTMDSGSKGISMFKYTMYEDPHHTLEVSKPKRLTDKVVSEQHDKGLAKFKKFIETGMFKGGGKISNFDKLSDKVAKEYEGKPVQSQYQEEYGKYYSKQEAQEVGDKVAGKMKAITADKKAFGGLFNGAKKMIAPSKKYPNLNGTDVYLKSGDYVQVFQQNGDKLSILPFSKIGTGERPYEINISEVDLTSYKKGGQVVGKRVNGGTETLKKANTLAKQIRKDGESWFDAKKRAFAQLKTA